MLLKDDEEVLPVIAYRDDRTKNVISKVHEKMSFSGLYRHTGCQFQPFNSLYRLYADKCKGRLEGVTDFLMIPEYLMYRLCGTKAKEFTNATTTGVADANTLEFDKEIISRLCLPEQLFPQLRHSGEVIGEYEGTRVMLCATHDTASAVEGIPMEGNELYISSGTWSLLGVKTPKPITDEASRLANYSNEGGVGYNRYQKNIMGMWLVNELKREPCPDMTFSEIVKAAEESACDILVDVNAPEFLAPKSMKEIVRCGGLNGRVNMALDYFDASINRISAWTVGFRNVQKALLMALCMPDLTDMQNEGNWTELMVCQEELKTMPFGEIWTEYCRVCGAPADGEWFDDVKKYEAEVLSKRG